MLPSSAPTLKFEIVGSHRLEGHWLEPVRDVCVNDGQSNLLSAALTEYFTQYFLMLLDEGETGRSGSRSSQSFASIAQYSRYFYYIALTPPLWRLAQVGGSLTE